MTSEKKTKGIGYDMLMACKKKWTCEVRAGQRCWDYNWLKEASADKGNKGSQPCLEPLQVLRSAGVEKGRSYEVELTMGDESWALTTMVHQNDGHWY